jgi:hypothetical protein
MKREVILLLSNHHRSSREIYSSLENLRAGLITLKINMKIDMFILLLYKCYMFENEHPFSSLH